MHGHHSFGALILQLSFFWIYVPFCNELLISLDHKGTGKRERENLRFEFFKSDNSFKNLGARELFGMHQSFGAWAPKL